MRYSDDPAPTPEDAPEYEGLEDDTYKARWREWVDVYGKARKESFRDDEYYHGDVKGTGEGHWTAEQLATLNGRNQPPTVFNVVARKVNAVSGVEQRARSEPRALPRTPKDQYAAEIATDALRYIKEQARWDQIKAEAFLDALRSGYAAVDIGGAEDSVPITPIQWREFAFDPRSRRADFSDARWLAIAKWIDKDVALATYAAPVEQPSIPPQPQTTDPFVLLQWQSQAQAVIAQYQKDVARRDRVAERIESTAEGAGSSALADVDYDEMPGTVFGDRKRQRIFVVDMWHEDAKHGWYRCVFTGAGRLFTEAASLVEKNRWGKEQKASPIKAFSLFVSGDGWRYGIVRNMRSPQDEYNARRSKAMHLLTVNQIITRPGNYGTDGNKESLRREATRPDGVLEVSDPANFRIEKNLDLAVGQQRLGEEARQFLDGDGANLELQGQPSGAKSGRAILAMQQAGLGQLGPVFDRFHEWEDRCYTAKWFRVQQFWTAPMYVRVTDDKNAAKFAAVNGAPVLDENGQPKMRAAPAPMAQQPQQPTGMLPGMTAPPPMLGHNGGPQLTAQDMGETGPMLAELDMDIIIDRAQEAATLQAEEFETLAQLAQAGVLQPGPETARLIITASSLLAKTQLLDMLDKASAQPQQPNPQQMAELKELAAKVEKLIAERDKVRAETAKIAAEIPETQARTAKTGAQARAENINATMNAIGASQALRQSGAGYSFAPPPAAGAQPGDIGLPPAETQTANGPPPY